MAESPRISLVQNLATRDGTLTKDAKRVNCFIEPSDLGKAVVKRPGMVRYATNTPGVGQGMLMCVGVPYCIILDQLCGLGNGVKLSFPNVSSPGEQYQSLSDTPYSTTVIKNSTRGYTYNGTTITQITDTNYPAATAPGVIYLDGTYYIMESDGTVRASALENPLSWPALYFIKAETSFGKGARIHRHLNYVVAFYERGMQLYYDAANATGSPLSPVSNASWLTGCPAGLTVATIMDMTLFVSVSGSQGRSVSALSGLQLTTISTPYIDRIINRSTLVGANASAFQVAGHNFYLLQMPDINVTLAFDLTTQEWAVWTTTVGTTEGYFRPKNYLNTGTLDLLQDPTSGNVYSITPTAYTDNGIAIPVLIRTAQDTWGSLARKFFHTVTLQADTVAATVSIRYSDDDYTTFSTYRPVSLSVPRKVIHRLGSARQRSFDIFHSANTPFRLYWVELGVELGDS